MRGSLWALLWLLGAGLPAGAAERFAVLLGANEGEPGEARLRHAERDAVRVADTLREVGGFAPENVVLLTGSRTEEVRRTLIAMNARIRQAEPGALLFVFYSGHADAQALHLRGTQLPLEELKQLVRGSPAQARVLVIDACRSGAATRVKGGKRGPAFELPVEPASTLEGFAILTSSAAGEDSQESEALGASFFTHALVSGLAGAADADGSGTVTLGEAFTYARVQTVASTVATAAGPQHPTFRYELGGREDMVLTYQRVAESRFGALHFPSPGHYLVRGVGAGVLAEVAFERGERRLALPAGQYLVTRREREHLLEGELTLEPGRERTVVDAKLRRVAFAQVVRKGGTERGSAPGVGLTAWSRLPVYGLGVAVGVGAVARLDLPHLALEGRVARASSSTGLEGSPLYLVTEETALSLAALHAWDVGALTLGAGLELGGAWLQQRSGAGESLRHDSAGVLLSPLLQAGGPLAGALHWRVELATPVYVFNPLIRGDTAVSLRLQGGAAWYF